MPVKSKNSKSKGSENPASRDLTTAQLSKAIGFNPRQIRRYVANGLPHSNRKRLRGGRDEAMFNLHEVNTWMAANGLISRTAASVVGGIASTVTDDPIGDTAEGESAAGEKLDHAMLDAYGLEGALERLRLQEFNISRAIRRMLAEPHPNGQEIHSLERLQTKTVQALRQAEITVIEKKRISGELVDFEDMVNAWEKICTGIQAAVLGVASTCVQDLRPYLKDPENQTPDVASLIETVCRKALMSLSNEVPRSATDSH